MIDAKLGMALQKVVIDAKEDGNNVTMKLRATLNAKGRSLDFIKGRETGIVSTNFKSISNVEVL